MTRIANHKRTAPPKRTYPTPTAVLEGMAAGRVLYLVEGYGYRLSRAGAEPDSVRTATVNRLLRLKKIKRKRTLKGLAQRFVLTKDL